MSYIFLLTMILLVTFSHSKIEFDQFKAETYLIASSLVYCPAPDIIRDDCHLASKLAIQNRMKVIHLYSNNATVNPITYAIIEHIPNKELIVSFSGTQNQGQLALEVLNSYSVDYFVHPELQGAKVIEYFYWYYLHQFRSDLETAIQKYASYYSDYRIVFTGHSLGGAMTVHAAVDSILSKWVDPSRVAVYTYGQPRVGNKIFTDILTVDTQEIFRVIHNRDLVAHIPPWIPDYWGGGCSESGILRCYVYHFPTEVFYNEDMDNFTVCDSENGEDPIWSNQQIPLSIGDHQNYFGYRVGDLYKIDEVSD